MAQRLAVQRIAAIAAILIASPIAHAEPVYLSCDGETITANHKVRENDTRSLIIDLAAGTATFDGFGPIGILPEGDLPDPKTGRLVPAIRNEDSVMFITLPQEHHPVQLGILNRITGHLGVEFKDGSVYSGTCKVGRRLF
jgi:hypothetical protein